ncbi:hypothetical protein KH172YL63_33190 [Bacillus sp. KH172YL63]|nr:hypothetical protein KH172YL63_33190 [Bacillus sp. KH172YL63]
MHSLRGVGISYRNEFADQLDDLKEMVDFLEISPELFYHPSTNEELSRLKRDFTLVAHSLSLSMATFEDINERKLDRLIELSNEINAPFITDHLAVSSVGEYSLTDFIPSFFIDESIHLLKDKARHFHHHVGRQLYLENITYQFNWPNNVYSECEFWVRLLNETEIGMLLDVSNLYVNSVNHDYDPYQFFDALPKEKINHLHIAGFTEMDGILIDSHAEPVHEEVWRLLEYILENAPVHTINLERDMNLEGTKDVKEDLKRLKQMFQANYIL